MSEDSEISADLLAEAFLQRNEALGDILGDFVCRLVLIEIFAEGFDTHVTAVRHQIGDGVVGFVHDELDIGLHPRHSLCNGVGFFSVIVEAVEIFLNFRFQLLMRDLAILQILLESVGFDVVENVVDGADAHFHAGIAFPKQTDGILFDHKGISFRF